MSTTPASAPPWIGLLLSGLAGRSLRVQGMGQGAGERAGERGALRPVLADTHLLLPAALWDDDAPAGLARAAVAHAAAHVRHSTPHQPTAGLRPMTVAMVSALEDARIERRMMAELPGLRRWWAPFHAEAPADDLSFGAFMARLARVLFDPRKQDGNHWIDKGRTLFEQQASLDLEDLAAFRRIASVLANDLGQMRVRFEPQAYRVEPVYRDDNSWLWTHAEREDLPPPEAEVLDAPPQLAALELREVEAAPGEAASDVQEIELGSYLQPEWDHRLQRHRRDWCTVVETVPLAPPVRLADARPSAPLPRRATSMRLSRSRRIRRQFEGDDIDLDAAIEVLVDRRLGLAPEPRLFKRPGRETPRSSVLVLLDLSESANDRIAGGGPALIDLEQEAALSLVGAARGEITRVAVHGFNSNTRARVAYQRLLDFGAAFDAAAAGRVRMARARHSTRMGAALRHAADVLAAESSPRRSILVVTDGAPSDIDVFDPRYLIEDARAAVTQARRSGVQIDCVTLDPAGERDARRIFGWGHYRVVTNPAALSTHLRHVQARWATS